jgi:ribosomal-protein-alanine N-acetyltransferase
LIPPIVPAGEVTLRPWEPYEAGLYAGLRDELVLRFTTETAGLDEAGCRQNILGARRDPNHAPFAICEPGGRPVGNIAVVRRTDTADISYWLGGEARGRGWASAALRAATEWAFGQWPVRAAELEIDLANEASMWVAQAAGYRRRGTRLTSACGGPAAIYSRTAQR